MYITGFISSETCKLQLFLGIFFLFIFNVYMQLYG